MVPPEAGPSGSAATLPQAQAAAAAPKAEERHLVRPNDMLMLKLSNGGYRTCAAKPNSNITLGKMGNFPASAIIGKPYGLTYEIVNDSSSKGKETATLVVKDDLPITNVDAAETEATNENIGLAAGAQRLSMEDIQKLVDSGADGRSIIAKQIAEHSAFELKNSHSKQKYIARKESKYIRYFTLLTPNAYNVCDVEFQSRGLTSNYPSKIRELRPDTFGQLLSLSNVQPGSRTLCVEDASGCIIGGLLARMAGQGQLLQLHDADSPPSLPVLPNYNLIQKEMKPYQWIHWAMAEKDYEPPVQDDDITAGTASAAAAVGAPDTKRVEKDRKKQKRRLEQRKDVNRRRALLHEGHWDALVMSTAYDLSSMVDYLKPYLAGSANLVVHSPTLQPLTTLQQFLVSHDEFINVQVIEPALRRYQVFPGRTHPYMNGTAGGGFLLSATRVFTNAQVVSFKQRSASNKRKVDDTTQPPRQANGETKKHRSDEAEAELQE